MSKFSALCCCRILSAFIQAILLPIGLYPVPMLGLPGTRAITLEVDYAIKEELPIGFRIGNLMDNLGHRIDDLEVFRSSETMGRQTSAVKRQLIFKVTNYGEPGVDLFNVHKDGSLTVAHRVDREKLCSTPQFPTHLGPSELYLGNNDVFHPVGPDSPNAVDAYNSPKCLVQLHLLVYPQLADSSDTQTTSVNEKIMVKARILIEDINDNFPQWPGNLKRYQVTFRDGDPVGEKRHMPPAYDADVGVNAKTIYELLPATPNDAQQQTPAPFRLVEHAVDGLYLYTTKSIDREEKANYHLYLQATDQAKFQEIGGNEVDPRQFASQLLIDIIVEDINDNAPAFVQAVFTTNEPVPETTAPGKTVLVLNATDADAGINGAFHFGFSQQHAWSPAEALARQYFDVRSNGHIVVRRRLNVDQVEVPSSPLVSDHPQRFGYHSPTGPSRGAAVQFRFRVIVEDEAVRPYSRSSEATVVILVSDENDEVPVVKVRPASVSSPTERGQSEARQRTYLHVEENQLAGTPVALLQVYDPDFEGTDRVTCQVENHNFTLTQVPPMRSDVTTSPHFTHTTTNYQVVTRVEFDRETTPFQLLPIVCSDSVGHTTLRNLTVHVTDRNDNPPRFVLDEFHMVVDENSPRGTQLRGVLVEPGRVSSSAGQQSTGYQHHLSATDSDEGSNAQITYRLKEDGADASSFTLDPLTGTLATNMVFDREVKQQYLLQVVAVDHGGPSLTGTAMVKVTILDVNDNAPQFIQPEYNFKIAENQPSGTVVGQVKTTDLDISENAKVAYYLSNDKDAHGFHIDRETGVIRTRQPLDREVQERYSFLVLARDSASSRPAQPHGHSPTTSSSGQLQNTGTASLVVHVDDLNDNWPVFVSPNATANTLAVAVDETLGHQLAYIHAVDADSGENGVITYHIRAGNPNGVFGLDADSGLLYLASNPSHKLFLPQEDHQQKVGNTTGYEGKIGKQSQPTAELHQKNSFLHILTLEACDRGKQPQPKCTLFNNLRIFINLGKESDGRDSPYGLSKGGHGALLNDRVTQADLKAARLDSSRPSGLSGSDAVSYVRDEYKLRLAGSRGPAGTHQRYNVNEVVTVCLSMIFVFILLATIGMTCLLRRRSLSLWKKVVVETNPNGEVNGKDSVSRETPDWRQRKEASEMPYAERETGSEPYQRSITNAFATSMEESSDFLDFSPPTTCLVENTTAVCGTHDPMGANHYHQLARSTEGGPCRAESSLTMMQSDNAVLLANRRAQNQLHKPLSTGGSQVEDSTRPDSLEAQFLQKRYMGNENAYRTMDYLGLFSTTVPNRYPYLYGTQRCLVYSPTATLNGTSRLIPNQSFGFHQPTASTASENVPLTHLNQLTSDISPNHPTESSLYRGNHCHSLSQPQPLDIDQYSGSCIIPHSPSGNGLVGSTSTSRQPLFLPQVAGRPQTPLQLTGTHKSRNRRSGAACNQGLAATLSPVYRTRQAVQSHTYHDIRQPDTTDYGLMTKSRSQQLHRPRKLFPQKYPGARLRTNTLHSQSSGCSNQLMDISQTLAHCDNATAATLTTPDDAPQNDVAMDKGVWTSPVESVQTHNSSELSQKLSEESDHGQNEKECKRHVAEAYSEASFV